MLVEFLAELLSISHRTRSDCERNAERISARWCRAAEEIEGFAASRGSTDHLSEGASISDEEEVGTVGTKEDEEELRSIIELNEQRL